MNSSLTMAYQSGHAGLHDEGCPYQRSSDDKCIASLSSMLLDGKIKEKYCRSENHDACPLYISKLLRGCR